MSRSRFPRRHWTRLTALGLLPAAASMLLAGCANSDAAGPVTIYPVEGQVRLADGTPLMAGRVVFVPTGDSLLNATGTLRSDGSFTLRTGGSGEGAPPGAYKVRIEADESTLPRAGRRTRRRGLPFPEKYADEDASGLTATVREGPNSLVPFRLTR